MGGLPLFLGSVKTYPCCGLRRRLLNIQFLCPEPNLLLRWLSLSKVPRTITKTKYLGGDMSKFLLSISAFLFLSIAQASHCNIAKINELGLPYDTADSEFNHNSKSFIISTPSGDYEAEVYLQYLKGTKFRQLIIRSGLNTTSALFLDANDHPFISMTNNGTIIQFQCWIDAEETK